MGKNQDIFQNLIAGGFIGAALGELIAKDSKKGSALGAMAGAVILATLKANEDAIKTELPVYVEENGVIYAINKGVKTEIKKIEKSDLVIPKKFKLK